jgi:hypothetical protein
MNMKKSIAGVMAGAMAISAMATVASADQEQIVLSYDLKKYVGVADVTTVSVTASYGTSTSGYAITGGYEWDSATSSFVADTDGLTNGQTWINFTLNGIIADDWALEQVDIKGTQIAREDENGKLVTGDAPSATYYSSITKGQEYQYDSKEDQVFLTDTDGVTCMETAYGNAISSDRHSFMVKFATTANAETGAYIVDTLAVTSGSTSASDAEYYLTAKTKATDKTYTDGDATVVTDATGTTGTDSDLAVAANGIVSNASLGTAGTTALVIDAKDEDKITAAVGTLANNQELVFVPVTLKDAADPSQGYFIYTGTGANDGYIAVIKEVATTASSGGDVVYFTKGGTEVDSKDKATKFTSYADAQDALTELTDTQGGTVTPTVDATKYDGGVIIDGKAATTATTGTTTGYAFGSYTVTYTIKSFGNTWDASWRYRYATPVAEGISGYSSPTTKALTYEKYAQDYAFWAPTATVSKSTLTSGMDVIAALKATKDGGKTYTNPVAVINDVIANNEEVAFTFTTIPGSVTTQAVTYTNDVTRYDTTYYKDTWYVGLDKKTGLYNRVYTTTWDGDWSNPTFTQHLYGTNNKTDSVYKDDEAGTYSLYGSYSSAWGTNLFNAGITVNSAVTMQLNDTTAFTWGDNSITFLWNSITDSKVTNATTLLSSMLLYTPVEWYWDSLDISVGSAISEDIVPGAGAEDDGEVVEDTDASDEEAIIDEDDIEDEIADDDFYDDDFADDEEEPDEDESFDDFDEADDEFDSEDDDEDYEEIGSDDEEFTEDLEEDLDSDVDADADADTNVDADADAATKEVESPKTGNAPIALAVIPVALAAAAVVAKKKN